MMADVAFISSIANEGIINLDDLEHAHNLFTLYLAASGLKELTNLLWLLDKAQKQRPRRSAAVKLEQHCLPAHSHKSARLASKSSQPVAPTYHAFIKSIYEEWSKLIEERIVALNQFETLWSSVVAQPCHDLVFIGGGLSAVSTIYYLAVSKRLPDNTTIWIIDPGMRNQASYQAGGMIGRAQSGLYFGADGVAELASQSFAMHQKLSEALDGSNTYGYSSSALRELTVKERSNKPNSKQQMQGAAKRVAEKELGSLIDMDGFFVDEYTKKPNMAQLHPAQFCDALLAAAKAHVDVREISGRAVGFLYADGLIGRASSRKPDRLIVERPGSPPVLVPITKLTLTLGSWADSFRELYLPEVVPPFLVRGMKEIHQVYRPSKMLNIPPTLLFSYIKPIPASKSTSQTSHFANFSTDDTGYVSHPEIYVRPSGDLYCLLDEGDHEDSGLSDPFLPNTDDQACKARLEASLQFLIPNLHSDFTKTEEQSCFYPARHTPDGLLLPPVTDKLFPWLFANLGHAQWGITLAPICGQLTANLILGDEPDPANAFLRHQLLPQTRKRKR